MHARLEPRQGPTADAHGPRLDAQIPFHRRGIVGSPGQAGKSRWRTLRRWIDGKTSFSLIQLASDTGNADALVFFLFDLLYLDGEAISSGPLVERKGAPSRFADECRPPLAIQRSPARTRPRVLCEGMEGIISNRADAPYSPGNRGLWLKGQVSEPRGVRGRRLDRSPKVLAHCSGRYCWPTTIQTGGLFMPGA